MSDGPSLQSAREIVSEQGRELIEQGLTTGVGGNLSRRVNDSEVAISPSGIPYDRITPEMVPVVDLDGEVVAGTEEPSTETPMHTRIYGNRPGAAAVVHTHSPYATALSSLGDPIPASHYLVSFIGDEIPVAGYATPGSEELGRMAADTLGESYNACLLQNHGVISVGDTVENAIETALMVEFCARNHYLASTLGDPVMVPDESIEDLRSGLTEYRSIKHGEE
jgi:L-fuculose-phosphate aldolase